MFMYSVNRFGRHRSKTARLSFKTDLDPTVDSKHTAPKVVQVKLSVHILQIMSNPNKITAAYC